MSFLHLNHEVDKKAFRHTSKTTDSDVFTLKNVKISPNGHIVSLLTFKGSKTRIDPSQEQCRDNDCIRGAQNKNKLAPPGGTCNSC